MKKKDPVVHFEIPAKDKKRMQNFYETIFGWQTQQLGDEMGGYVLVTACDRDEKTGFPKKVGQINGGFYQMTDDPISQSPSIVIAVDDIHESIKKVENNGGKLSGKVDDIPGIGLIASFIDTEGNRISMMQPTPRPEPEIAYQSNITTCLWFDEQAEEAVNYYVKVFNEAGRSAKIGKIARYGKSGSEVSGQTEGKVMTVEFELDGNKFMGLNGGPIFQFSAATSFVINCKTQEDVDYFWNKLGEGGQTGQCGWINADKFGVTWQIVPTALGELMSQAQGEQAERVMKSMLSMKKLNIQELKDAFEGK